MLTDDDFKDTVLGSSRTYCAQCVRKACRKKNEPYNVMVEKDRGKHISQLLKKFPWKDAAGEPVLICHNCLEEMANETK